MVSPTNDSLLAIQFPKLQQQETLNKIELELKKHLISASYNERFLCEMISKLVSGDFQSLFCSIVPLWLLIAIVTANRIYNVNFQWHRQLILFDYNNMKVQWPSVSTDFVLHSSNS